MTVSDASGVPDGLASGGAALWSRVTDEHDLDPLQEAQLLEACRAKDRLDKLDLILRADVDTWAKLTVDVSSNGQVYELRMTQALPQANATANMLKQLLAALRLPDEKTGKRPQVRSARGAYKPREAGSVSSLERARARASGA